MLQRFLKCTSGNFAITFAVVSSALVGAAGMAVHFSQLQSEKVQFQNALDASVLAAIGMELDAKVVSGMTHDELKTYQIKIANDYFSSNYPEAAEKLTYSFKFKDSVMEASGTGNIETPILAVLGIKDAKFTVTTAAVGLYDYVNACIMAMHPTRKHTLESKGSVDINAPDCHIYGNSDHIDDVIDPHTPNNHIVGASVQAVGYGHHYIQNVTPPIEHAPFLIPDPFAKFMIPTSGTACDNTNLTLSGGTHTLKPGTYCGGLEIKKSANVTLSPGLYKIVGGDLTISDSTVLGEKVTLALTSKGAALDWSNAVVQLSAPTSGQYTSMVIIGVREEATHTFEDSTIDLHGVIYLPNGEFEWENTGTPTITADWMVWIVDGFSWTGDGTINFPFKIAGSSVPYPGGLNIIPRPNSTPRLVY
ncbi:TadE/TadG family type IV pilus assembly protein [Hoeflea sp.]|uniref:TadE/TadG family type IV pilus assembly protein n=1 Tax=Hoeflea sp. TaxID=1940281 RepID=UPI0019C21BAE|nr:TadE/TadG family type IV pilus assembly protein [Hoeflea sp.]MBC7285138.1 pilus assembly protein [Hoeflea sp.]